MGRNTRERGCGIAVILTMIAAAAHGQTFTPMRLLALTDTASVRVEVELADAWGMEGSPVRAMIASAADGTRLWAGELGRVGLRPDGSALLEASVDRLRPRLWAPHSPNLYHLVVEVLGPDSTLRDSVRVGFRSFEASDGRLLLNGRPIFLRGNAINPPERMLPDSVSESRSFVEDYVRFLKDSGVNIIRLLRTSQIWLDVADEQGMMIYQGNYGTPEGGKPTQPPDRPFEESIRWYREDVLRPLANHPSVVVYVLSNEQASPEIHYLSSGHQEVERFLTRAYQSLRGWDDSRAYIGNAGYGFGRSGDICDLHRYWGWYNNSFLSYYTLRDPRICWRTPRPQPITLTESVGNYTGVDGRFNLVPDTKQPDSQLNWTGHAPDSAQSRRSLAHQAFTAKQAIEITRRLRARNPHLAGIAPFTILFRNWAEVVRFEDMDPKPVARQYAVSYQPVLLSWELWTSQVYSGSEIVPVAHVVNDSEPARDLSDLTLHYSLRDADGAVHLEGTARLPDVPYFGAVGTPVPLHIPALSTGLYVLTGEVRESDRLLSTNTASVFVAEGDFAGEAGAPGRQVTLYDGDGSTGAALRRLGVSFRTIYRLDDLDPARDLLLIGQEAWDDELARAQRQLRAFVDAGGRVLLLAQDPARFDPSWLPGSLRSQTEPLDHPLIYPEGRPYRNGMAVNPERPDHPVFAGIDRDRLFLWSDPTAWDESQPGFPAVYPVTSGFSLRDPADLAHTAILANYDHGLEGIALAEVFGGGGSAVLTGFGLIERVGLDPVADRILLNLIRYQAGSEPHHPHVFIDSPIVWGDYESERGLVTGIHSGMLLNSVPVVPPSVRERYPLSVDENGFHFAGGRSGWNTKPSIQYVPRGRRPFGPYSFSFAGSVRLPAGHGPEGEGRFWLRVPADRKVLTTRIWNPVAEPLEMEIEVNGAAQREVVPGNATVEVATPIHETDLRIIYRGDRRLVLLRTDFPRTHRVLR